MLFHWLDLCCIGPSDGKLLRGMIWYRTASKWEELDSGGFE